MGDERFAAFALTYFPSWAQSNTPREATPAADRGIVNDTGLRTSSSRFMTSFSQSRRHTGMSSRGGGEMLDDEFVDEDDLGDITPILTFANKGLLAAQDLEAAANDSSMPNPTPGKERMFDGVQSHHDSESAPSGSVNGWESHAGSASIIAGVETPGDDGESVQGSRSFAGDAMNPTPLPTSRGNQKPDGLSPAASATTGGNEFGYPLQLDTEWKIAPPREDSQGVDATPSA